MPRLILLPLIVALVCRPIDAQTLSVDPPITDHAVVQQGEQVWITGRAAPNATVHVTFGPASADLPADETGAWIAILTPMPATAEPRELVVESGGERVTVSDILVGDIWLCSGQSNMEWPVRASENAQHFIASANYPQIRMLTVPHRHEEQRVDDLRGEWRVCSPEAVGDFSAVAYHFGRIVHLETNTPVGLIHSSWGGSAVEAWTPRDALESCEEAHPILERHARDPSAAPPRMRPFGLFNGMIHPLRDTAIRGVIWYQGESNADRAEQYATLFPLMIEDWRDFFDAPDLPFYFVQLANLDHQRDDWDWPGLRDAQLQTLREVPNTGMAVTIDIGDSKDIHPRNKHDVGYRLAQWALADVYNVTTPRGLLRTGPLYREAEFDGSRVVIRFDLDGSQLNARDGGELRGFTVAGPDREFVPANASIVGATVVVEAPDIAHPIAVRYAWSQDPKDANLENAHGLPASPFRTDDWPLDSAGKR